MATKRKKFEVFPRRTSARLTSQHSPRNKGVGTPTVPKAADTSSTNTHDVLVNNKPSLVNSQSLPLPWLGRLGYACLNSYLRTADPPVFSSRTCRIASILEHQYPLVDPSQPEHARKNPRHKTKPPSVQQGLEYVQALGLANARDIVKMLHWNDKYNIKFMRLSSQMFPFASHEEYGYSLVSFAADVLADAGKVAARLGHRLTTHPGQFTQIASPRKPVITASMRDLEYHNEMLSLLKLPPQMDRDAVMILHMGGTYGDKAATIDRFRENYAKLSKGVKQRLVLENDDVAWTVNDLLPICEELNIPLVLDFHHHNILSDDAAEMGENGKQDITTLYDSIEKTWTRKNIRQKMHYSEPTAEAVTPREKRKHSARVAQLPPCPSDMDLMIEAKDKEQAVFELMKIYKLPGWERLNTVNPHERDDQPSKASKKASKKASQKVAAERQDATNASPNGNDAEAMDVTEEPISAENFGMGGPESRVYWPEGKEEWLSPKKRKRKADFNISSEIELD